MDQLAHKQLLILGLARQGKALARFACGVGASVTISDLRPAEKLQAEMAELADLPIEYALGAHPISLLDDCDIVAISGSVPADAPFVNAARERGISITNDSLEFLKRCPSPHTVGITGSAGKTTTTSLVGEIGRAAGRTTWVGGNIGHPLVGELSDIHPADLVVQELSSFQLEIWPRSPHIAAVLNITPNHLDRHHTMDVYTAAKANIMRHQTAEDVLIVSADDPASRALADQARGRVRYFSGRQEVADGAFLRDGHIILNDGMSQTAILPISDIQLIGYHNILNVLAACTIADTAGLPISAMQAAIRNFTGVEHRLELVRTLAGVRYINDSIATAPERALAAIQAFNDERLILLAGGRDKNMRWDEWTQIVLNRADSVVLFGSLADMLGGRLTAAAQQIDSTAQARIVRVADNQFDLAVKKARELASAGDIVLMSPGGTSYDAFKDFAERGQRFRDLVNTFVPEKSGTMEHNEVPV